jgi:hypothetical protein
MNFEFGNGEEKRLGRREDRTCRSYRGVLIEHNNKLKRVAIEQ